MFLSTILLFWYKQKKDNCKSRHQLSSYPTPITKSALLGSLKMPYKPFHSNDINHHPVTSTHHRSGNAVTPSIDTRTNRHSHHAFLPSRHSNNKNKLRTRNNVDGMPGPVSGRSKSDVAFNDVKNNYDGTRTHPSRSYSSSSNRNGGSSKSTIALFLQVTSIRIGTRIGTLQVRQQ